MAQDLQISFFDCCKTVEPVITVKATGHPRYRYVESVARCLTRWITVKARAVYRCLTGLTRRTCLTRPTKMPRVLAFAGGLRL